MSYIFVFLFVAVTVAFNFPIGDGNSNGAETCNWVDCKTAYMENTGGNITDMFRCLYIVSAQGCLNEVQPRCLGINLEMKIFEFHINKDFASYQCSNYTPTPSVPTSSSIVTPNPSSIPSCTGMLPKTASVTVKNPSIATYRPALSLINALCKPHSYHALRHCSIFTYTHVRQFNGSHQTCTLPGSWYLLRHSDVIIEVTGGARSDSMTYTRIDKVLINSDALFNNVCNNICDL